MGGYGPSFIHGTNTVASCLIHIDLECKLRISSVVKVMLSLVCKASIMSQTNPPIAGIFLEINEQQYLRVSTVYRVKRRYAFFMQHCHRAGILWQVKKTSCIMTIVRR